MYALVISILSTLLGFVPGPTQFETAPRHLEHILDVTSVQPETNGQVLSEWSWGSH